MFKFISLNYTVMLNGYSQRLNISKKKKNIPRDISSIVISDTSLSHKNHATKQI